MINFFSTLIRLTIRGQGRHLFSIRVSEKHILKAVSNLDKNGVTLNLALVATC